MNTRMFVLLWAALLCGGVWGGFAAEAQIVPGSPADLARFRKPPREVAMVRDGFLWVEAEDFADYGEWRLDTQFVHLMGSAYLLAGGVGQPIRDAATELRIPRAGTYRVWVRAKNWLKEFSPGRFTIQVGDRKSDHVFGAAATGDWCWEPAGDFQLPAGPVRLALHDRSGAFARCDALVLTTDQKYVPPEKPEACAQERRALCGLPAAIRDAGDYDVVVAGAGTAGCCAALAAARMGARTVLVQDRPVLGGNASTELGVPPCGAASSHPNARESGLIEECALIRAHGAFPRMSEAFQIAAAGESNLTVCFNQRVIAAELQEPGRIGAVRVVDTLTMAESRYRAKMFIDCTGDGWLGFYAGAKYRFGRESRDEFQEDLAPPQEDKITMSGCIMGQLAIGYRVEDQGHPAPYTPPAWAARLPPPAGFGRNPKGFAGGQWWMEHPGDIDDLYDAERARDELIRITFGYWDYMKNAWAERASARNFAISYVPHMDARRETRRLVGDYLLKQQDAQQAVMFPDRISYGGWPLDVHNARGIFSGKEGPFHCDAHVPIYSIPFRCLYSTNVVNLLFAGRDASVTHIALGSIRVEATLATLGQAAGTAAALCLRRGVAPRELGEHYIGELQQTLLKYDQYIPGLKNEDPADLARTATVTASSTRSFAEFGKGKARPGEQHELVTPRAEMFPRGGTARLHALHLLLDSELTEPAEVVLHLRGAAAEDDFSSTQDVATATAKVPAGRRAYVAFKVDCDVDTPYLWISLPKTPGISWSLMDGAPAGAFRAYGGSAGRPWTLVKHQNYAWFCDPPLRFPTDHRPENAIDGVARIVGAESHAWASDPQQPLPQWLELAFPKPVAVDTVQLTFDTRMNSRFPEAPVAPECVKDYRLSSFDGKTWVDLAAVKDNFLRHRIHRFAPVTAPKIRLTVEATQGDASARVFEIRAYREGVAK